MLHSYHLQANITTQVELEAEKNFTPGQSFKVVHGLFFHCIIKFFYMIVVPVVAIYNNIDFVYIIIILYQWCCFMLLNQLPTE